ncbi:sensor histidine kinase [Paenibacillus sp. HWE-109]|uniref:sensor histidine kinase n=1 Tax=Paenibacillus sp. HWE-109 TaxID=1306526 RepID=UPI001EE0E11D|nr:sensor histidine kinase [Paenibacillus sp. HWE-109]UKS30396.1 sensor histidine kinase [Paenibacillus sp. HWE-109]
MNKSPGNRKKPFDLWYLWFFYLIFPVMSLSSTPLPQMWIGFALLAFFALCVTLGFKDAKRRLIYVVLICLLVMYFATKYSPYLIYMFFYAIPLMGLLPTTRQFISTLVTLVATVVFIILLDFDQFYGDGLWYFLPSLVVMLVLPFGIRSRMKATELKMKLTVANDEITRLAMLDERQRISRDLHDTLGHTLSLITLKSELAEKLIFKNPEKALLEVKDIQATSRAALRQVRELISGMNTASVLEELKKSEEILQTAGIVLVLDNTMDLSVVPPIVQNILGMILREAITNVIKHTGATKCTLRLWEAADIWGMSLSDNGPACGQSKPEQPSSGRGLLGMKERLAFIEGTMSFHKGMDIETKLVVQIPRIIKHS